MKRIFFLILILALLPFIAAVEIEMSSEFNQGETLIAEISGNFYESLSDKNVIFYRDHVRTSIIPTIGKIDDKYYVYAQLLDKSPGNYSFVIEDLEYFEGNQIIEEDIRKNFSITSNFADFSIDKGFLITDEDFFVEIRNLKYEKVTISIGTSSFETSPNDEEGFLESLFGNSGDFDSSSITLSAGEKKKVYFQIEDKIKTISFKSENSNYEVIVESLSTEDEEKEKSKNFRFEQSLLDVSMATNSEANSIIYLRNMGEETIENISITFSESLIPYITSFSEDEIDEIDENSTRKIEIVFSSNDEERIVEGLITATSGDDSASLPVSLNFLKDFIPSDGESSSSEDTCSAIGGKLCKKSQKCSGDSEYTNGGICCLAECEQIKESSTGKIIGWLILLSIIIFIAWFYLKKYKKVESISDLTKILSRK